MPDVSAALAEIGEKVMPLSDEERRTALRFAHRRKLEFAAGRHLARQLLRGYGCPAASLPADQNRRPVWPAGFAGSISHSRSLVAVALMRSSSRAGLGIDIEENESVGVRYFDSVLRPSEIAMVRGNGDLSAASTIFSCKEAVFKAVSAVSSEKLEFLDLGIRISGNRFCVVHCASDSLHARIQAGVGHVEYLETHVMTLFCVA